VPRFSTGGDKQTRTFAHRHRERAAHGGGVHYVRDVFASAPDSKRIVVRLTADKPGSISFRATMNRPADVRPSLRPAAG